MLKPTDWAKAVKARDGKCQYCGKTTDLHAHHIKPKSTHPALKYELNNGMTLCYACHKVEHELHRPVRIRSGMPQRRTLLKRLAELEKEVTGLRAIMKQEVSSLEKEVAILRTQAGKHSDELEKEMSVLRIQAGKH
jgi:hypothetical protein